MLSEKRSVIKNFRFTRNDSSEVSYPITIPVHPFFSVREVVHRIMEENNIPLIFEESLVSSLKRFIEEETECFENEKFSAIHSKYNDFKDEEKCRQKMNLIMEALKKNSQRLATMNGNDVTFADMYHELIHSGFLTESIVSLENCFSMVVSEMISSRNKAIEKLTDCHSKEMGNLIKLVGISATDEDVNKLSAKHFREVEELQTKWDKEITQMKLSQKSKFTELIKRAYNCYVNGEKESILKIFRAKVELTLTECGKKLDYLHEWETLELSEPYNMEESFTINLGSQLKTTHNLRLTSRNMLELCCDDFRFSIKPSPQRIQTAMSMYSNTLSGLVLLVDNRVNSYSGIKKDFAKVCSQSTEFHFPSLEEQQHLIRELKLKSEKNKLHTNQPYLKPGDFYITKHSNLTQIHIVFHLVSDDSVTSAELSSRHPVILGLRNILKLAYMNDVTVLSLPLLLIHEMTENITLQWCLKRAELVLKCVKGFMIEMASLSPTTDDNKTLQFIVPKGISEELFASLATMLAGIFRLSNPLVLKSQDLVFNN
ncbi:hypothetical protein B4U79_00856 [Dinothrombium tinctorium]|uniref:Uncharacterized protein n=1 Tax=Dinothrombium tinctorium TaxID=1965070 RepID=A0A3S4R7T2_9ACAR|nr:hypothetical protein B4U79_02050 [Dinothrombium tinctorium]RWS12737.1 hypothetical protein B4U79_05417 [Dinothrombium tinctorium]RWS13309.1 hypothetical protein B4U79_00856 [Dinothrombium tinctorium]